MQPRNQRVQPLSAQDIFREGFGPQRPAPIGRRACLRLTFLLRPLVRPVANQKDAVPLYYSNTKLTLPERNVLMRNIERVTECHGNV